MSVKEQITEDMKKAMKKGEALRKTTLKMLLSEIKYAQAAVDIHVELDEPTVIKVILRYQKRLEKSLEDYPEGEHKEKIKQEILVVSEYLPVKPSSKEIDAVIDEVLKETPERSFGVVMKKTLANLGNMADGKVVSQRIKEKLNDLR